MYTTLLNKSSTGLISYRVSLLIQKSGRRRYFNTRFGGMLYVNIKIDAMHTLKFIHLRTHFFRAGLEGDSGFSAEAATYTIQYVTQMRIK